MNPRTPPASHKKPTLEEIKSDSKLSKSAQKLKSILKSESECSEMMDLKLFRNSQEIDFRYCYLPIKLYLLTRTKQQSFKRKSYNQLFQFSNHEFSKLQMFFRKVENVVKNKEKRQKIKALFRLIKNVQKSKNFQKGVKLFLLVLDKKCRSNLHILFESSYIPRILLSSEPIYSLQFMLTLNKMKNYNKKTFFELSTVELKQSLDTEMKRFNNARLVLKNNRKLNICGSQIILIILSNHIRALFDINNQGQEIVQKLQKYNEKKRNSISNLEKDSLVLKRHEQLLKEFQLQEIQLDKLVTINEQFVEPENILQDFIEDNKNSTQKLIKSRIRVLKVMLRLIKIIVDKNKPSPSLIVGKSSIHELGVSHVRAIVQELDEKVYELSTISEQIPQLQTFKRTLDLTMPQHNINFTKIVNVIIQLHHKVNRLLSRRPQHLMKQIQTIQVQCTVIETSLKEFIMELQREPEQQQQQTIQQKIIKPITFNSKKSPEHFKRIHMLISSLSEHIMYSISLDYENQQKMHRIKHIVELFWNILSGMDEFWNEWYFERERQKSQDEDHFFQMLENSLRLISSRKQEVNQLIVSYEQKIRIYQEQSAQNNQYLEEEVVNLSQQTNKLKIQLQRLGKENNKLTEQYAELQRYIEQYRKSLQQQKKMIQELKRTASISEKRDKTNRQRIESLQSENQQKKGIINNINNDMKRMIRESQTSKRNETKIKQLHETIEKLKKEKQELKNKNKILEDESRLMEKQKEQNQKNSQLLLNKLDELKRKLTEKEQRQREIQRQLLRYRQIQRQRQIQQQRQKQRQRHQESNKNNNKTPSKHKNKNKQELEVIVQEKQQRITQLNTKIVELNNKLNNIVDKYKGMEFEVKKCEQKERELKLHINTLQSSNTQQELANALSQLQNSNKIVKELEEELKRREQAIWELQNYNQELVKKNQEIWKNAEEQFEKQILQVKRNNMNGNSKRQNQLSQKIRNIEKTIREQKEKILTLQRNVGNGDRDDRESHQKENGELRQKIILLQKTITEKQNTFQERIYILEQSLEGQKSANNRNNNQNIQNERLVRQKQDLKREIQKLLMLQRQIQQKNNQLKLIKEKIQGLQRTNRQQKVELDKAKEREMTNILSIKQLENKLNSSKDKNNEIQYLLEKVRSLQDFIDILIQENRTLQEKIKQFRKHEWMSHDYSKQLQEKVNLIHQLEMKVMEKEKEIQTIRTSQTNFTTSPQISQFNQSSYKHRQHSTPAHKLRQQQQNYLEHIRVLEKEVSDLKQNKEKYYLRIQGQRLQKILQKLENGSVNLNFKIDQAIKNSRRTEGNVQSTSIQELVQQNKFLISKISNLANERQEMSIIIKQYPNPQFLTEFVFKIILHFAQLHPQSPQASNIWKQLVHIRQNNQGGQYFIALEQFTKYTLQENAIQVYRKALKAKTEQLQNLRNKLNIFLNQRIHGDDKNLQKTVMADSRMKVYRDRYRSEIKIEKNIETTEYRF